MRSCSTEKVLISKHENCDTPRVHAKDNAFLNKVFPSGIYILIDEISPEMTLPQAEQSQLSACPHRRAGPGPSAPWWSLCLCLSYWGVQTRTQHHSAAGKSMLAPLTGKKNSKGESFIVSKKQTEDSESLWGFSAWEVPALIPGGPSYHTAHSERDRHSAFKRILLSELFTEPTCLCKSSEPPCQPWGIWITLRALLSTPVPKWRT